jgi:hypothetical protein
MGFTCWITKVTDRDSEYVILAFPLQQWLRERTSLLRYTYIACLVRKSKEKSWMVFILLAILSDYNDKLTNSVAEGNILSVSVW